MSGPWEQFQEKTGPWSQFAPLAAEKPEEPSGFLRQVADVPLGITKGVTSGIRMLSDIFGADNPVSQALKGTEGYLNDLMSAQARNDQKEIARIMKEAEDKGVLDQVVAGVKAFATAPIDMLSQAAGTAIPAIAGGLAGTVLKVAPRVASGLTGVGMGTGVVKGTIYEETKQALKEAGVSEDQAKARAQLAQSYGGKNLDQILLGSAFGGLTAVVGVEPAVVGALTKRILAKEATEKSAEIAAKEASKSVTRRAVTTGAAEAAPEFLQAAQEQIASNIAQQREGLDVDALRGAVASGTLEGLSALGLGASVGAVTRPRVAEEKKPEEEAEVKPPEPKITKYAGFNTRNKPITIDVTENPDGTVTAKTSDGKEADITGPLNRGMSVDEAIASTFSRKGAKPATPITEEAEVKEEEAKVAEPTVTGEPKIKAEPTFEVPPVAQKLNKTLYHGTNAAYDIQDFDASGGMAFFGDTFDIGSRYAYGAGGQRRRLTNEEKYVVNGRDGVVYELGKGNLWNPVGIAPEEGLITSESLLPLDKTYPPISQKDVEQLTDPEKGTGEVVVIPKTARVTETTFKDLNLLDITTPEGRDIISNLKPSTKVGVNLVNAAKFDQERSDDTALQLNTNFWGITKQSQSVKNELRKDVVEPLKKLGYDGIYFQDDQNKTYGLFDTQKVIDQASKKKITRKKEVIKPKAEVVTSAATITQPTVTTEAPPKLTPPEGFKLKKGRNEQVVLAARQLEQKLAKAKTPEEKKAARDEYDRYVDFYMPIRTIKSEFLETPIDDDVMNDILVNKIRDKKKPELVNAPIADGTRVGLRMDIPALEWGKENGVNGSVVSIHKGKDADTVSTGDNLSYKSAGALKDVTFAIRREDDAFKVAQQAEPEVKISKKTGKEVEKDVANKTPQQTMEGTWVNMTPDDVYAEVQKNLNDPAWTQISIDPLRHSFFYDRATKRPVLSADEVLQVGRFVLAKNAKFGKRDSFLYAQATPGIKGNPKAAVQALINKVKEGWVNAPNTEVVQSINELPRDLQRQIEEDGVNPRGAYHPPTNTVYIISDNIAGYRDAFVTLTHEALGHFGLRSILGDRYNSVMENFYETNSEIKKLADKKIKEGLDKATAVEEVLAEAIEDRIPQDTLLGKAIQMLKNIIRQFAKMLGVKTLNDEEVQSLLDAARDYVIEGRSKEAAAPPTEGRAVFAKAKKPAAKRSAAGEAAMQTVKDLGREQTIPPGTMEKALSILKDARENPSLSKEEAKQALTRFMDMIETKIFATDAALNNAIRRVINDSTMEDKDKIGLLLSISSNQAVHADAIASLAIQYGSVRYNPDLYKYEAVEDPNNFIALSKAIDEIVKNHGLTKEEAERVSHTYFEARRLNGVMEYNERVDAEKFAAVDKRDKAIDEGDENAEKIAEQEIRRANDKYKKVHMTREHIDQGLELVKTIPELDATADIWYGIRQNNVKTLVDSGLWSADEADLLLSNIDYVPFYREDQLEKGKGPKEFLRGIQVPAKEKKFKGSDLPVADILDNMVRWTQYAVKRSVMNKLGQAKIDAAVQFGLATPVEESKKGPNSVRIWRDGKAEFYDMADPLFMESFAGIESVALPIWKVFAAMSNFLRQSVVLYPLFSVSQVPQDAFAAMFSSGLKTRFALSIPARAVKEFILTLTKSSKTHEELRRVGAVGIRDFSAAVARNDAEVAAGLKKTPGIWNKVKGMLEHISMASDNAVRQAVYSASIAQGLSTAEAMEKAFAIINFRNRGSSPTIRMLGQVVPFFNAYLAAQHVAIKTISGVGISPSAREDALKTLAATTGTVMALSFIYAMAMDDDEDYIDKPSVMRDRLFIIPGTGMSIPIRTDIFSMPKILTEHMYMLMTDQGMTDGRKFRDSMKAAMGNILFGPTPVPQAIKPAVEVLVNYNFFQGRPLIGTFQKGLEVERQFNDSTSELAKLFGQTGLVSPIAADHLFRGMLGSLGGLIVYATNPILHNVVGVPRPELSFREAMAALPGTSGFVSRPFETGLKNDFYVLRDEVAKAANTFNDIKRRSPADIEEFLAKEDNVTRVGMQKAVNKITEALSKIRREISVITNLPTSEMSAAEKRTEINNLREMERDMLRDIDIKELRRMANL